MSRTTIDIMGTRFVLIPEAELAAIEGPDFPPIDKDGTCEALPFLRFDCEGHHPRATGTWADSVAIGQTGGYSPRNAFSSGIRQTQTQRADDRTDRGCL